MVAVSGDQLVAAPLHGLLSMTLLALMIGAGAAFDALARRAPDDSRARRAGTAALAAVVGPEERRVGEDGDGRPAVGEEGGQPHDGAERTAATPRPEAAD